MNDIKVRWFLEGTERDEMLLAVREPPWWLSNGFYLGMTLVGMGWLIRLILYRKTVYVNYYLKKIVIK